MCAYGCLIIREACKHGGDGWAAYDSQFCQVAAAHPGPSWVALDLSLHASTFLATCTGSGTHCRHCVEANHQSHQCALAPLHTPAPSSPNPPTHAQYQQRPIARPPIAGPLNPICMSWNRGKHAYHPSCTYRHICATCYRGPHPAKDCAKTPASSGSYIYPAAKFSG